MSTVHSKNTGLLLLAFGLHYWYGKSFSMSVWQKILGMSDFVQSFYRLLNPLPYQSPLRAKATKCGQREQPAGQQKYKTDV